MLSLPVLLSVSANSVSESLEESAAAYTKATAKKCILEKVEVKTGEESESNVLQVNITFLNRLEQRMSDGIRFNHVFHH